MLEKLKRLDLNKVDLEEAIALVTFGETMVDGFTTRGLEVPGWLTDNVRELNREIRNRQRDNLEMALRETDAQLESLKTASEKRADLQARRERLKQALDLGVTK